MQVNDITDGIIGAAIRVHRGLGPGLLESAYAACLTAELTTSGLSFERQVKLPVTYGGVRLDCGYRMDFVVERRVVVEIKSVAELSPIHTAQLLTYLRLSGHPIGLLINFNVRALTRGSIRRLVLGYAGPPPRETQRR